MRLLLDTHIFLWLTTDDRKAKKSVRVEIEAATEVYVSAASVWEVAIKHTLGKIEGDPQDFHRAIEAFGFRELAITGAQSANDRTGLCVVVGVLRSRVCARL